MSGLLGKILQRRSRIHSGQAISGNISWLSSGEETTSGVNVTPEDSLSSTAVLSAVRRISQAIAMLPLPLYKRNEAKSRKKERAPDHPLYEILHTSPNPELTSFEYREMIQASILIRGNGYSEIERDRYGGVKALWPLRSDMTWVERKNGKLWYHTAVNGTDYVLDKSRVFHIKGFSTYGLLGLCIPSLCKEAIGTAIAQEKYHGRFFGSGAIPGGVLEYPGALKDDARKNLETSWEFMHKGFDRAHRIAILEEGMTFKQAGVAPKDAELISGRTFSIQEVARIFDMPPPLLGELSHATFTNIEQQGLWFVVFTLQPRVVRWEQRISKDLLSPEERKLYFAEFLLEGLLRGDSEARGNFYGKLFGIGALSPNDIRELENMNTIGAEGDKYYIPLNMIAVNSSGGDSGLDQDLSGEAGRGARRVETRSMEHRKLAARERLRLREVYKPVILDAAGRLVRAEIRDIRAAIKKHYRRDKGSFLDWLDGYFGADGNSMDSGFGELCQKIMKGTFEVYGGEVERAALGEIGEEEIDLGEFRAKYFEGFVLRHSISSRMQLRALILSERSARQEGIIEEEEEILEELEGRLGEWDEKRAGKIAEEEGVRLCEAVASAVFVFYGFRLAWATSGKPCPLCSEMDGRIVEAEGEFLQEGDTIDPGDGATEPLKVSYKISHPPLHGGCKCYTIPA